MTQRVPTATHLMMNKKAQTPPPRRSTRLMPMIRTGTLNLREWTMQEWSKSCEKCGQDKWKVTDCMWGQVIPVCDIDSTVCVHPQTACILTRRSVEANSMETGRESTLRFRKAADMFMPTKNSCTRSSAIAERQRVSYTRLSRLTHWSCTSLSTASVLQHYNNRLAKLVSTLSADKPCDIRTLSWIGHSRSLKVILIGAGRNQQWSVVVMSN